MWLTKAHTSQETPTSISGSSSRISGIVISGISYALYGEGLREVSMEKAMIICLAEPVLNPLWVYLGKGEIPSMTTVIGSILILLSAIIDIVFSIKNNKKTITN